MARPLSRQFGARTRASGLVIRESSQRSANLELHFGPRKNEGMAEVIRASLFPLGVSATIAPQSFLPAPESRDAKLQSSSASRMSVRLPSQARTMSQFQSYAQENRIRSTRRGWIFRPG